MTPLHTPTLYWSLFIMSIITLCVVDTPDGQVSVTTNSPQPRIGQALSPAESLALSLLTQASHMANAVHYNAPGQPCGLPLCGPQAGGATV